MTIKNEKLFLFFADPGIVPTEAGREQFVAHQSRGEVPSSPDPFYAALSIGKRRFDLLCREYQQMFVKGDWWGFVQLWRDWKGRRWVLPHLCTWYGDVPDWLGTELPEREAGAIPVADEVCRCH